MKSLFVFLALIQFLGASLLAGPLAEAQEKPALSSEVPAEPPSEPILETTPAKTERKTIWFPIVYYTPETQIAGGILAIRNLWKEREGRVSNLLAAVTYTSKNQSRVYIVPKLYFDEGAWELNALLSYSYYPNKFFGRGVLNSTRSPEFYTENDFAVSVGGGRNLISSLYIRGALMHEKRKLLDVTPGGRVDSEVQLTSDDLDVNSYSLSLDWDSRDSAESPRDGGLYKATYTFSHPYNRANGMALPFFTKTRFDLRHYYRLQPEWILAGQLVLSSMEGAQIPFQYLNSIGGGSVMRGFYAGQYRDRALGLAQTELRYEKFARWTPAVFASVARLESEIRALSTAESFYSAGFGAHYLIDEENRTKLRIDIGFTGQETGFYVLIGEAF